MGSRVTLTFTAGLLALPGCFNPEPDLTPSSGMDSSGTSTGGVPDTGDASTGNECIDGGCTTSDSGCAEDCSLLDDECNVGVCDGSECVAEPRDDGTECDDGLFCTEGDVCTAGVCGGTEMECPGEGGCTIGVCNEDADSCDVASVGEGDACDDENPCTSDGTCVAGACEPGPEVCGELSDECNDGVCNPGVGCDTVTINEGGACDVANPCAASACVLGSCTMTAPINEGLECDDGDFCSAGDVCLAGACTSGVAAACPADGPCGTWTCDEMMDTCILNPQNEGMPCDDGNLCTPPAATQCAMGECLQPSGGGPLRTYLSETFLDNSAGWMLGPEWEIGPAMPSVGGNPGADPDTDHTFSDDNGVAGVVIGGQAAQVLHPYYYLTSPPMSVTPGDPAILGFRRWLNSDYDPFMHNSIEVWDGASWQQIWVSGPAPEISDTEWVYIEHDLSAYANDAMRVRFGFDIGQDGVYSAPSWNVDDVLVASIPCP